MSWLHNKNAENEEVKLTDTEAAHLDSLKIEIVQTFETIFNKKRLALMKKELSSIADLATKLRNAIYMLLNPSEYRSRFKLIGKGKMSQSFKDKVKYRRKRREMESRHVPFYSEIRILASRTHLLPVRDMKPKISFDKSFSISNPPMPWFGLDIGGTLVKLVYFEPTDKEIDSHEGPVVANIRKYLTMNTAYGTTGLRDVHLQLSNQKINGRVGMLHFIRFPVTDMQNFMKLLKKKGLAAGASTVCATGGGAFKFDKEIKREFNLNMHTYDELQSVIVGIQYIVEFQCGECYYFVNPLDDSCNQKKAFNKTLESPYLIVNVGSGVSIMRVDGVNKFRRVSGSSMGGGMFHGLCCLLCGQVTFEEALELASKGDSSNVDKLVKDIYGGDYEAFNLPGQTIAASFGKMIDEALRDKAKPEDLARSALITITSNIGSIARMCATGEEIETILFIGNFLRVNEFAMRHLAYATEYWSNGSMKPLFLKHEGYFGAVGCMINLMRLNKR